MKMLKEESEGQKQNIQKVKFTYFNGKDKISNMKYSILVLLVYFIFAEVE